MSVATRNPFALLDEDRSSTPPPAAEPAAPAPAAQAQPTRGRGRGGPASRGGRYYPRGGAAPPASPPTDDQPAAEPKPRRCERKEGRGRGRGRGWGPCDSDKKVHNSWGGDDGETERKTEEAATNDVIAENTASGLNDWNAPAADQKVPKSLNHGERRERRGDREEEEDNTLTFDQYLAQKRELDIVPKLDGAAPLQKKAEDLEYFAAKTKSAPKTRTKKDEKVFIEIEARFERPSRGGRGGRGGDRGGERGRGERGRGRGGRGRGGANGYAATPVNVDDESAFPSLS
ncbi:hypothetical protein EDB19DRAFT_1924371 [Suillus lakei]|nr:hypothetical protein EDB19DRAFT_1924371 [Suillus lakei]